MAWAGSEGRSARGCRQRAGTQTWTQTMSGFKKKKKKKQTTVSMFWTACVPPLVYLWVSRRKTAHVVVDLFEHEASVHQVETALREDKADQWIYHQQAREESTGMSQPWWRLPDCGWHFWQHPGCLCTSAWCVAWSNSPASPRCVGRTQKSAGFWTTAGWRWKRGPLNLFEVWLKYSLLPSKPNTLFYLHLSSQTILLWICLDKRNHFHNIVFFFFYMFGLLWDL